MTTLGINLALTRPGGGGEVSPLLTGLEAYWKLDEASGARADAHGSSDLAETGSVGYQTGKQGNAADFDYTAKPYVSIADNADLSFGDEAFSLAGWYFHTDNTHSQWIVLKGTAVAATCEYVLAFANSTARLRFFVSDGSTMNFVEASAALSLNTWYHVRCWHDPDANEIGIQLNNGAKYTQAHSAGCQDAAQPFGLGGHSGVSGLDGYLDEWGIWRRLLTDEENTSLYSGGDGATYPF